MCRGLPPLDPELPVLVPGDRSCHDNDDDGDNDGDEVDVHSDPNQGTR